MDIIKCLECRYTTKRFDPTKKISKEDLAKIERILQLSPSSTNSQPWHYVIASTKEGIERMAKGVSGYFPMNENKVLNASAVILFATKVDIDEKYLLHLLANEEKDGRFPNAEAKQAQHGGRSFFANMHKFDFKDQATWADKQAYISLGTLLTALSTMDIDSVTIEGANMPVLTKEFELDKKGYSTAFIVALGYRDKEDANASLPKSRLPISEIITRV